jgi:metallo-beta-lactamase family protein
MKIRIVGAAGGEVTGSAYIVHTDQANVLIDAGMFQGGKKSEAKNKLPRGVDPKKLSAILLTHAHLDHTGRVPLLMKHGFRGTIFATAATLDLAELILRDSARLQEQDAKRKNRKKKPSDVLPAEPLYRPQDVEPFRDLVQIVPFKKQIKVARGMTARWVEAGHMPGSGSVELIVEENGKKCTVAFSGDLGPASLPLIRPFETLERADLVFLESTYGDRDHRLYSDTVAEFEDLIKHAARVGSKILVPTFAVGRSQQILYHLGTMFRRNIVKPFHVYLDSPMAIEATKVMAKHPDLFDAELLEWKRKGIKLDRTHFHATPTARDSQALNEVQGPCAILAGAGMCNGGRILHHFVANLPKETTRVLIVGYQGYGSLGRKLVDGAKSVKIFGQNITVRASVHTLSGFSAHASQTDLLKWFAAIAPSKPRVVLTHGEDKQRKALSLKIQQRFGLTPELPEQGDVIDKEAA